MPVSLIGATVAKVLVIEDEPKVRVVPDLLLRLQGFDVILAENGWKGSSCIDKNIPMSSFLI
jgi:DNA-binding response OmpR family regulator